MRSNSARTTAAPLWSIADPYRDSPGAKALPTLFGGEHMLGGIAGYNVTETTDEKPSRVTLVQRVTWAFLRTALDPTDPA